MSIEPEQAMQEVYDVLIIGAGPAGSTAAIYTARARLSTLVVHRGLGTASASMAERIVNYPGIPNEITGDELVRRMHAQAESFGAQFVQDAILTTDLTSEPKSASGNQGYYRARSVIIATGSMGRGEQVDGEEDMVGRGVSYCATCDGAFYRDEVVAVAGNHNEAVEEAMLLTRFAKHVHLLVQTPELRADPQLVEEISSSDKVTVHSATRLLEVVGDGEVTGVRIRPRGQEERTLEVSGVFIYLQGRLPITDFVGDQLDRSEAGCLRVGPMMETAIPGVFAVGDLLCNHLKQLVVAAGDGATAARAAERFISGRERLQPDWH
jgi:thioredoxin reductase (NADPH)